ncbi:MAG: hypothetical protein Q9204_005880 [Flavoplaca sp. TL-2023a]
MAVKRRRRMRWAWRRYADERRLRQRDKERADRARCGKGTGKMMALARPRTSDFPNNLLNRANLLHFYLALPPNTSPLLPFHLPHHLQPR